MWRTDEIKEGDLKSQVTRGIIFVKIRLPSGQRHLPTTSLKRLVLAFGNDISGQPYLIGC